MYSQVSKEPLECIQTSKITSAQEHKHHRRWHNRLNSKLRATRSPHWCVIHEFQREQQNSENVLVRMEAGIFPRLQRVQYRRFNRKFKATCASYHQHRNNYYGGFI